MLKELLAGLKQKSANSNASQPLGQMTEIGKAYLEKIGGATDNLQFQPGHDMFSRNYPDPNPYWRSIVVQEP